MNKFPCLITKVTSDLFVIFYCYQSVLTKNNFHPVLMGLVQTSNNRALPALPQEHYLPFKKAQINEGIFKRLEM